MLFKVSNCNGKFIQYISLCINKKVIDGAYSHLHIKEMLQKTNIPTIKDIRECAINAYTWYYAGLNIQCYNKTGVAIILSEILSSKRKQDLAAKIPVYTRNATTLGVALDYSYGANTTINTNTSAYSTQYQYPTYFSTRTVI